MEIGIVLVLAKLTEIPYREKLSYVTFPFRHFDNQSSLCHLLDDLQRNFRL